MAVTATPDPRTLAAAMDVIGRGRAASERCPFVLGLCGSQGSGKSTLAVAIVAQCAAAGMRAEVLSLDDLYLGKARRADLARSVHPLLATRGVPGTHDVALGLAVMDALDRGEPVRLPQFDKATDDCLAVANWPPVTAPIDVLVFEGWCVGAVPQDTGALVRPVNRLEAREDPDGRWRLHVNTALAGVYQQLFARIDRLMLLAAPGFEVVEGWRRQQEAALAAARPDAPGLMDEVALSRFVSHYERLTRHILSEMPGRADCTARLDADRRVTGIEFRRPRPGPG